MRSIRYLSGQNEHVRGLLYEPPAPGKYPAVLFTHGLLSARAEFGNYPERLSERGYVTLAIDLRGHGESEGHRGFFSQERAVEDIRCGIDFLAALPDVDVGRLALVGHSLGAACSICAAAADERVKAVVAIAPPARIRDELKPGEETLYQVAGAIGNLYKRFTGKSIYFPYRVSVDQIFAHESPRQAARAAGFLQNKAPHDTGIDLVNHQDTLTCAAQVRVPTLVMQAEHDQVVTTAHKVYETLAGPKEFIQIGDSGHSIMTDTHGNEAFDILARWLAEKI